ncbi:MAG TPA: sigma-54 dependent transcriptional regulator [Polyangiaceae bacterium]|nr:sigma-54 dependent transcriptional regulator [Polyangiaceae bacterium]
MRILLIDDDLLFARSLQRAFSVEAMELELVSEIGEARQRLLERRFDLLLLDLFLGQTDGLELLETWPGEVPLPPVIVLSGRVDVRETVRCIRAGAISVLQKPATPSQIIAQLEAHFRQDVPAACTDAAIVFGDHPSTRGVRAAVSKLAHFSATNVLLCGETGTGKSTVALALHQETDAGQPFVAVNCAAIPSGLFESELFGAEAGAYTGAKKRKVGLLESAGTGTVFLDEVAEMAQSIQPKLLRVLETREFSRVGSAKPIALQARVISATSRPQLAESSSFRSDLYYRLAGFSITLTPLRDRSSDVEPLAQHFLQAFSARHPGTAKRFTRRALELLTAHSWPGNLRELRSVVTRSAIASAATPEISSDVVQRMLHGDGRSIEPSPRVIRMLPRPSSLRELERTTITEAFRACHGNVSEAARRIGLPRSTVRDKLRRYGMA